MEEQEEDSILYVIIEKRTEAIYGYGGYTGEEEVRTEVLGYCRTEEHAREKLVTLRAKADKEPRAKWIEYDYELATELS